MVPALSSRGQSSAFGKSHLNTFSLVPELNLLHHTSPVIIIKYNCVHLMHIIAFLRFTVKLEVLTFEQKCVPEQSKVGRSLREADVVVLQTVVLLQQNGHGA